VIDLDRIKDGAIAAHAAGELDRWALRDIVDLVNEVRRLREELRVSERPAEPLT
jgi:hypothetical protein